MEFQDVAATHHPGTLAQLIIAILRAHGLEVRVPVYVAALEAVRSYGKPHIVWYELSPLCYLMLPGQVSGGMPLLSYN